MSSYLLLSSLFFHLIFCKIIIINSFSFEWKGIVWVLRLLFMIYIFEPILPVRKFCLITTSSHDWSITLLYSCCYLFLWFNLIWLVRHFICCRRVHSVRINYFVLFFWIKSILLSYNLSLTKLLVIFFLIIRY